MTMARRLGDFSLASMTSRSTPQATKNVWILFAEEKELSGAQKRRVDIVPGHKQAHRHHGALRAARRSATTQFDASRAASRVPRLLRRDVGDPHDLAPLLGFSGDEGSELLGIERHRHRPQIGETPAQVLASYPGNASAIVGTSGSTSKRRLPATASARSAPVRTCGSEVTITSKPICTWPASRSVIMDAPPR